MGRWRYFFARVALSIPILFLVMTLLFIILRLGPLDPVNAILGEGAGGTLVDEIRASLGLNEPLWRQYIDFMLNLITFEGQSWVVSRGTDVTEMIWDHAPRTIWLGFWAILLPLFIGIPLGFYAGLNPNSWGDYIASFSGIVWLAMPNFWLAIILLMFIRRSADGGLFGLSYYELMPGGELNTIIGPPPLDFYSTDWVSIPLVVVDISVPVITSFSSGTFIEAFWMILPAALVLGSASMATELRIGRTAILETINSNYVETARAKGLSERIIIWKHVFRNALIPLIPVISNEAFLLIGGSVIVEVIFGINGLGWLFFEAATEGDLPLAGSLLFFFAVIIIFVNIIQDLLYTILDPRVGFEK